MLSNASVKQLLGNAQNPKQYSAIMSGMSNVKQCSAMLSNAKRLLKNAVFNMHMIFQGFEANSL